MAKGLYFGVNSVARKVKKLYFGVGGVARKVKKMYFGAGGVARICYSAGISKVNKVMNVTEGVGGRFVWRNGACAPVGDKLVVGMSKAAGQMDTFNTSLTKGSASLPLIGLTNLYSWSATSLPSYAVFAGGKHDTDRDGNDYTAGWSSVYCYNSSLNVSSAQGLGMGRYSMGTGSIGDYATFAGGSYDNSNSYYSYIESCNNSLLRGVSVKLNNGLANPIGLNVTGHLVYAHGYHYSIPSVCSHVYALDSSLYMTFRSISRATNFSTSSSSGASNGSYALYMSGVSSPIDVVSSSLVVSELPVGTDGRLNACGISFDEQAVFAGGALVGNVYKSDVITFNKNLVRDVIEDISVARKAMFSGRLGNFGFLIGSDSYLTSNVVDIYEQ